MKKILLSIISVLCFLCLSAQEKQEITLYNQANALYTSGSQDMAIINKLEQAVEMNDSYTDAFCLLATAYLDKGAPFEARDNINKAIKLDPAKAEYYWIRARTNITANSNTSEFKTAIADIDKAISMGLKSAKVYKAKGLAEQKASQLLYIDAQAQHCADKAEHRKQLVSEAKQYASASINSIKQALAIDPAAEGAAGVKLAAESLIADLDKFAKTL